MVIITGLAAPKKYLDNTIKILMLVKITMIMMIKRMPIATSNDDDEERGRVGI